MIMIMIFIYPKVGCKRSLKKIDIDRMKIRLLGQKALLPRNILQHEQNEATNNSKRHHYWRKDSDALWKKALCNF